MARGWTRMICVGFTNSNYFVLPELISEKQVKSFVALTEEVKKKRVLIPKKLFGYFLIPGLRVAGVLFGVCVPEDLIDMSTCLRTFILHSEEAVSPSSLPPATQTAKAGEQDAAIKESLCKEEKGSPGRWDYLQQVMLLFIFKSCCAS